MVEEEEKESTDTEITLGMKSLLGVFFGSVLVCGVFFGLGYSLGRGSARPAPAAAEPSPAIAVKPSTGSDSTVPASTESASIQTSPAPIQAAPDSNLKTIVSDPEAANTSSSTTAPASAGQQYDYVATPQGPARKPAGAPLKPITKPHAGVVAPPVTASNTTDIPAQMPQAAPQPVLTAVHPAPPAPTPAVATTSPAAKQSAVVGSGSIMVQIAAISRQEDADILVSALRKHGYSVVVRNDPKDSLLHVQIGPFGSRDDAKAMRTRLLADGYNAILK